MRSQKSQTRLSNYTTPTAKSWYLFLAVLGAFQHCLYFSQKSLTLNYYPHIKYEGAEIQKESITWWMLPNLERYTAGESNSGLLGFQNKLSITPCCLSTTNVLQLSRWNLCILLKKLSLFPFRCYLTLHMLLKTILSLLQVNIKQTYQPLIISICPSRFPLPWRAQTEGNSASHLTQTKLWWL